MYGRMHNQNSAQYILYYNRALYHIEKKKTKKSSEIIIIYEYIYMNVFHV